MTPFLKWAGGKTQLLDLIIPGMPKKFGRYFEPFVGSGALFLAVAPKKAYINDVNPQLVNIYRQFKDSVNQVLDCVDALDSTPCDKEIYQGVLTLIFQ